MINMIEIIQITRNYSMINIIEIIQLKIYLMINLLQ